MLPLVKGGLHSDKGKGGREGLSPRVGRIHPRFRWGFSNFLLLSMGMRSVFMVSGEYVAHKHGYLLVGCSIVQIIWC